MGGHTGIRLDELDERRYENRLHPRLAMAFTDLERRQCERALEKFLEKRRPPSEIRARLDLGYRIAGQSVEIFSIRPKWRDPRRKTEEPIAKATYVRTRNRWRIYWMRHDLKWHGYEPDLEVRSIERFLAVVDADEYGCFWG